MITRSIFARFLFAAGIVSGSLLFAAESGTQPEKRTTSVTRQEVWRVVAAELIEQGLADRQLPRVEDIDLPVAVPALAGRRLRVVASCWDAGARRTQFRLQCSAPGQCLPFLTYLRREASGDVRDNGRADMNADAMTRAASCQLSSGPHSPRLSPQSSPPPMVRAGDRATAVFVADRLRLAASVICLERGRKGEAIRVRSQDGHIFRARISGPALLETLPQ